MLDRAPRFYLAQRARARSGYHLLVSLKSDRGGAKPATANLCRGNGAFRRQVARKGGCQLADASRASSSPCAGAAVSSPTPLEHSSNSTHCGMVRRVVTSSHDGTSGDLNVALLSQFVKVIAFRVEFGHDVIRIVTRQRVLARVELRDTCSLSSPRMEVRKPCTMCTSVFKEHCVPQVNTAPLRRSCTRATLSL